MKSPNRVVVVANRLPVTARNTDAGMVFVPSTGGLVTALTAILSENGGSWVGWSGSTSNLAGRWRQPFDLVPVQLSADDIRNFYYGCSNEIVWPLFHDLQSRCHFDPGYWNAYCAINERFADTVKEVAAVDDFVWVHDYHLMLQAEYLRTRGLQSRIGYFHHIPFPAPDIFDKLPWRNDLLRALLAFDLVGFQTARDRNNFTACVRRRLSSAKIRRIGKDLLVGAESRQARVGTFPISIDFRAVDLLARHEDVTSRVAQIRNQFRGMKVIVGVDRLDYTKGILQRLSALEHFLSRHEEWLGRVVMLQLVVPSREEIGSYSDLKQEIERQVSEINGRYGRPGWMPVHFLYRSVARNELMAMYGSADVALVTPLKDGMNLVAKEYCAAHPDNHGVLLLSEFAGAADELGKWALTVNPNDTVGISENLQRALSMPIEEQLVRMTKLRERIREHDVFRWQQQFFRSAQLDKVVTFAASPWPQTMATAISA
jgi:trehalose 6-phosphate synthase